MQLLAHALGGRVAPSHHREYGPPRIHRTGDSAPLPGLDDDLPVWMSHGDRIESLPPASASWPLDNSPYAAMGNGNGPLGIQFHPEVVHTPQGTEMLANFLFDVAGLRSHLDAGSFIEEAIAADSRARWAMVACSAASAAASIRRWRPRWCTAPSATS